MNQISEPLQSASRSALLSALPSALHAEATQRYQTQHVLLHDRLARLYGHRPDFDLWFNQLLNSVSRLYAARPEDLCVLDRARAAQPNWFLSQKMLGYCAYVDRFAGTLCDVHKRIPHLRELGVNYLHLLPFLLPRTGDNDGGFAVASFDEVNPRLGTMADLQALTASLRVAGISLCADMVLNHVADDHLWAKGVKQGNADLRDYFHIFPDRTGPDDYERTLGQVFPHTAPGNFTEVPQVGWVWTTFYPYQWDLNYSNPQVFAEIALALLRLANRGVEIFRLDSAAFLWKRSGTNCMNQPEVHWILQALRALMQIAAPGVLLKAEAIVPTVHLAPYFGEEEARGHECHLAYQSSLMAAGWAAVAEQNTDLLYKVLRTTPALPPQASWITYVRCHDDIGWNVLRAEAAGATDIEAQTEAQTRLARISHFFAGNEAGSFARGTAFQTNGGIGAHGSNGMTSALLGVETATSADDIRHAVSRMALLHGLALCVGGLPVLYMGDEFALGNDYSTEAKQEIDGRWLHRPRFDEAQFEQRLQPDTVAGQTYVKLRQLIAARQYLPDLTARASLQVLPLAEPSVLALRRGTHFCMLGNFSEHPVTIRLAALSGTGPLIRWQECLSHVPLGDEFVLDAWGMVWLEVADEVASK